MSAEAMAMAATRGTAAGIETIIINTFHTQTPAPKLFPLKTLASGKRHYCLQEEALQQAGDRQRDYLSTTTLLSLNETQLERKHNREPANIRVGFG